MRKYRVGRKVLFLLLAFFMFKTEGSAVEEIRFTTLTDNPPFSWLDGNIERGIDVDIVREAAKRAGYAAEFMQSPWKRLMGRLKNNSDDGAFPLFYRAQREEFALFTTVPIRMARFSMFVSLKGSAGRNFEGMETFANQRVGQVRGLGVSAGFKQALKENNIKHMEVTSTDQGLQLLTRGRFDGFVNDTITTQYMISKMNLWGQIRMLSPEVNEGEGVFLVFSKKHHDNAAELVEKFDRALKSMYEDGTIISIIQFYLK